MSTPGRIRVGISGWTYAGWRGDFYPTGLVHRRELAYAAERLGSIEVNGSFYSLQRPTSYRSWREQTPDDFIFSVKGGRYITHLKRLVDVETALANFFASGVLALGPKLGPILWQLPPTFRRDDERLAQALEALPPGRHCFEFRHETWFAEPVYELLRCHGVALVIGDAPERPFQAHELTADWTFIRFHRGHRGRNSNYSKGELEDWAQRIEAWARRAEVYAYFNNDWNGYAVRNGLWLRRRLGV